MESVLKMSSEERDVGKLLKEIEFKSGQIQEALGDIEQLLKDTKRLFCKIQENMDKHEKVRNLWLGQLRGNAGSLVFQNVASTPNPLFPLTETQRTLIRNIVAQVIRLQALQDQLEMFIDGLSRNIPLLVEEAAAGESSLVTVLFLAFVEIGNIQREIQEVRANLALDVAVLFGLI